MGIMSAVVHPLAVNTHITATKPSCPCKGAKFITVKGKVLKVIQNHMGYWYYLDCGHTVKADWIQSVG